MATPSTREAAQAGNTVLRTTGPRSGKEQRQLLLAVSVVVLILIMQLFVALHGDLRMSWADIAAVFEDAWQKLQFRTGVLLMLVLGPLGSWLAMRAMDQRLEINQAGIAFSTRLPGFAKRFQPDWQIAWNDLERVEYGRRHPMAREVPLTLIFFGKGESREINAYLPWRREGEAMVERASRFYFSEASRVRRRLEDNALFKALEVHGIELDKEGVAVPVDKLRQSKGGIALTAIVIAAFIYGIVELAILRETYFSPPWYALGAFAAFSSLAGLLIGTRLELGNAEKASVSVVLGIAMAFAAYPGALRLNILLDDGELLAAEFRFEGGDLLEPVDGSIPAIDISRYDAIQRDLMPGSVYKIRYREGRLGIYQFDIANLRSLVPVSR